MWVTLSIISAFLLGFYDISKKKSLERNDVLVVLLAATGISAIMMSPMAVIYNSEIRNHLRLILKAALVASSWISGMIALKLLPITTVSTLKATRPFFVVLFSILIFGERLSPGQWTGTALALAGILLLGSESRKEEIRIANNRGFAAMAVSILTGVASALYDKHLMAGLEPLFVQSWTNIYITAILALCLLVSSNVGKNTARRFTWDWTILLIAVLITVSDACYFFALKQDGALLSVISLIRRGSVIISFAAGVLLFGEKNIKGKCAAIALVLAGIVFLSLGS